MLSTPPATKTSPSPQRIARADLVDGVEAAGAESVDRHARHFLGQSGQ